jgi:hypothetical protein
MERIINRLIDATLDLFVITTVFNTIVFLLKCIL